MKVLLTFWLLISPTFIFAQQNSTGKIRALIFEPSAKPIGTKEDSTILTNNPTLNDIYTQNNVYFCEKAYLQGWGDTLDKNILIFFISNTSTNQKLFSLKTNPLQNISKIFPHN